MAPPRPLPPAPAQLVVHGLPQFGAFTGLPGDAHFGQLGRPYASGLAARLTEKRWLYTLVTGPDVFVCLAIIDLGYLSSGFLSVFDRRARKLVFDENLVLPPGFARVSDDPGAGQSAELKGFQSARIARDGDRVHVEARWGRCAVDLLLDAGPALPPLGACAAVAPGRFDYTQKWVHLAATGDVKVGKLVFPLEGAPAGLDYTHGQLARDTRWRWAFADGFAGRQRVAFNFSEGFLGPRGEDGAENAVWVDGAPCAVGPVTFAFDPNDPFAPWTIRSADGGVDLAFTPEGFRAQDLDLKLILSRYVQPFGEFRGHLTAPDGTRVELEGLAGVTEDHAARW